MKVAMARVLNKKNIETKAAKQDKLKVYAQKKINENHTKQSIAKEVGR